MYLIIGLIWIAVFVYLVCTYEAKPIQKHNSISEQQPTKSEEFVDDWVLYGEVGGDDWIISGGD